jgi:YD repeat-containing protein
MVNVGTGNLLLRYSDMLLPHKGVPMDFLRTYNSQAPSVVTGLTNWQSLYGNGWTNSFDAHLVAVSSNGVQAQDSVYDVDGARYDYTQDEPGIGPFHSMTPGQNAIMAQAGCGVTWTKKDGTTYNFYAPASAPQCYTSANAGYAGRLYQIVGRNRNTYVTLSYTWDGGIASTSGKISQVSVQSESGMTTNLNFSDVNGRRLLQQLVFPNGTTTVSYAYDAQGDLTSVTEPANNAAGSQPQNWYGYSPLGSDSVMTWASTPRWTVQCNQDNCGGDGAFVGFGYSGSSAQTATIASLQTFAVVNPSFNDGFAAYGPLQQGFPTYAYAFRTEYYTTGVTTPTFRDTDGHFVNWVVDGTGRPTQTQVCTVSPSPGASCPTSSMLVTNEIWDNSNNRIAITDPRGVRTDMSYDGSGNVVAIAQSAQYQNYARPTTLIDYDSFNNIVAMCDPALVHSAGADWNGQYSGGSHSYCSSQFASNHPSTQYSYPAQQPYGEVVSLTSAGGYVRQFSYDASAQGGSDYGLATRISAASSMTQFDQTTRQPTLSATYDLNGNTVCSQSNAGAAGTATTVMTYDALNRLTASADPDDASLAGSCSSKAAGIAGSSVVTRQTYYLDGSLATVQSPDEAAVGFGTVYTYDADGNQISEAPYNQTPQNAQTARVTRWFDAVGRLIETQQPPDPGTTGDIPISLRYIYDLSQNQTSGATSLSGAVVHAHGNLFDTLKNKPGGWIDFTYSAFDSADRVTTDYAFAPCPAQQGPPAPVGAIYCSQPAYGTRYDWDSSTLTSFTAPGLVVATLDGAGAQRVIGYDALDATDTIIYSGDGSHLPQVSYAHDFDGRLSDVYTAFTGVASAPAQTHVSYTYTADARLAQASTTTLNSTQNTAVSYSYYPDATLAGTSATTTQTINGVQSSVVNQPTLYQYSYRNDGLLASEKFGVTSQSISWTFTPGGRMTAQKDFGGTSSSLSAQYADGYGRLSSYTTPSGTYGSFIYDSQGRAIRYTDPYTATDGETVSSTYNIRGDLVARTFTGGSASSKPGFSYKNIQGVTVQNPSTDQFDGRTGATLLTYDWGAFQYDQVGRLKNAGGSFTYDAESRLLTGDTFNASSAADDDCHSGGAVGPGFPPVQELTYLYDGTGRLFQDTNPPITVLGHQTPQIRQWVWNDSRSLYTMHLSTTGTIRGLDGFGADGHGSLTPDGSSPGLTLMDPDLDGAAAQYHNNTGHSTWTASNPYNQFCHHASPLAASANYVGPSANVPPDDGSSDPSLTVSSTGRAYLSRSMGFTTPDFSSATPYASSSRGTESSRRVLVLVKHDCGALQSFDPVTGKCVDNTFFEGIGGNDAFGFGPHGGGGGNLSKLPKIQCPAGSSGTQVSMLVTAYDNGPGSTGKSPGDPYYGKTSTGTTAQHGTIAADQTIYSKSTRMYVPGYGWGTVQDVGGAINNSHIDVWFPSAQQANKWGAQHLSVTVCSK